jgi:YHS domain-containing protein
MISALIREFLLPLLLFLFVRAVINSFVRSRRSAPRRAANPPPPPAPPPAHTGGVLHKDPICGTYVSTDSGVTRTIKGEVVYFCSPECRDKYRTGS